MDVTDTLDVLRQHCGCIAAGKSHVAAVEQQADFVTGQRHQAIDIGRMLDVCAHVMVISDPHATFERIAREASETIRIGLPILRSHKARAFIKRLARTLMLSATSP